MRKIALNLQIFSHSIRHHVQYSESFDSHPPLTINFLRYFKSHLNYCIYFSTPLPCRNRTHLPQFFLDCWPEFSLSHVPHVCHAHSFLSLPDVPFASPSVIAPTSLSTAISPNIACLPLSLRFSGYDNFQFPWRF